MLVRPKPIRSPPLLKTIFIFITEAEGLCQSDFSGGNTRRAFGKGQRPHRAPDHDAPAGIRRVWVAGLATRTRRCTQSESRDRTTGSTRSGSSAGPECTVASDAKCVCGSCLVGYPIPSNEGVKTHGSHNPGYPVTTHLRLCARPTLEMGVVAKARLGARMSRRI